MASANTSVADTARWREWRAKNPDNKNKYPNVGSFLKDFPTKSENYQKAMNNSAAAANAKKKKGSVKNRIKGFFSKVGSRFSRKKNAKQANKNFVKAANVEELNAQTQQLKNLLQRQVENAGNLNMNNVTKKVVQDNIETTRKLIEARQQELTDRAEKEKLENLKKNIESVGKVVEAAPIASANSGSRLGNVSGLKAAAENALKRMSGMNGVAEQIAALKKVIEDCCEDSGMARGRSGSVSSVGTNNRAAANEANGANGAKKFSFNNNGWNEARNLAGKAVGNVAAAPGARPNLFEPAPSGLPKGRPGARPNLFEPAPSGLPKRGAPPAPTRGVKELFANMGVNLNALTERLKANPRTSGLDDEYIDVLEKLHAKGKDATDEEWQALRPLTLGRSPVEYNFWEMYYEQWKTSKLPEQMAEAKRRLPKRIEQYKQRLREFYKEQKNPKNLNAENLQDLEDAIQEHERFLKEHGVNISNLQSNNGSNNNSNVGELFSNNNEPSPAGLPAGRAANNAPEPSPAGLLGSNNFENEPAPAPAAANANANAPPAAAAANAAAANAERAAAEAAARNAERVAAEAAARNAANGAARNAANAAAREAANAARAAEREAAKAEREARLAAERAREEAEERRREAEIERKTIKRNAARGVAGRRGTDEEYFGLRPGYTERDLDVAYRNLSMMHPNQGGTEAEFKNLGQRYNRLKAAFAAGENPFNRYNAIEDLYNLRNAGENAYSGIGTRAQLQAAIRAKGGLAGGKRRTQRKKRTVTRKNRKSRKNRK